MEQKYFVKLRLCHASTCALIGCGAPISYILWYCASKYFISVACYGAIYLKSEVVVMASVLLPTDWSPAGGFYRGEEYRMLREKGLCYVHRKWKSISWDRNGIQLMAIKVLPK